MKYNYHVIFDICIQQFCVVHVSNVEVLINRYLFGRLKFYLKAEVVSWSWVVVWPLGLCWPLNFWVLDVIIWKDIIQVFQFVGKVLSSVLRQPKVPSNQNWVLIVLLKHKIVSHSSFAKTSGTKIVFLRATLCFCLESIFSWIIFINIKEI